MNRLYAPFAGLFRGKPRWYSSSGKQPPPELITTNMKGVAMRRPREQHLRQLRTVSPSVVHTLADTETSTLGAREVLETRRYAGVLGYTLNI